MKVPAHGQLRYWECIDFFDLSWRSRCSWFRRRCGPRARERLHGTVSDQTGGVLPGVSVDLRPASREVFLETVTDFGRHVPV